jgi:hypothetical protein
VCASSATILQVRCDSVGIDKRRNHNHPFGGLRVNILKIHLHEICMFLAILQPYKILLFSINLLCCCLCPWYLSRYSDWLRARRLRGRSSSPGRVKKFTSPYPALGPTRPPIQWVPRALSPGVKRPGHEAYHSFPASS